MEDLIYSGLAMILTYVIGLFVNKPGYKKPKNVINAINKALEDDNLTVEELKAIRDAVK